MHPGEDIIEGRHFSREAPIPCPLCGTAGGGPRVIPVLFGMRASVAECARCRIAYQTPRPSPAASLAYMDWRWRSTDDYVGNRAAQAERARKQLNIVKQHTGACRRIVDFGAGAGAFVRTALEDGRDAVGVERSEAARMRAREFHGVDLFEKFPAGGCDVITLWDVVEHLRDPVATLTEIATHLTEEGLLFVETGNLESWRRVGEGDRWGLYLFDHQFYFSPSALRGVLVAAGFSGFQLLDVNQEQRPHAPDEASAWDDAMARWPTHGNINVMVAIARKTKI